jgi:hypothetical protein
MDETAAPIPRDLWVDKGWLGWRVMVGDRAHVRATD